MCENCADSSKPFRPWPSSVSPTPSPTEPSITKIVVDDRIPTEAGIVLLSIPLLIEEPRPHTSSKRRGW